MINLETIKTILFSDETMQARFLGLANAFIPPISGDSFDEKLSFLLEHASEEALQKILAPCLRERVFQYLANEETDIARSTKQTFIEESGMHLYESMLNGVQEDYGRVASAAYLNSVRKYFADLRRQFTCSIGQKTWEEIAQARSDLPHENLADFNFFHAQKSLFKDAFPQPENLWESIHQSKPAVQEFYVLRQIYINTWGDESWEQLYNQGQSSHLAPIPEKEETENEEDLGFPIPPNPLDDFLHKKTSFISQYGPSAWTQTAQLTPPSEPALKKAYELKNQFIQDTGEKCWSRIYMPPKHIQTFDEMKKSFVHKWGQNSWDMYISEREDTQLDPIILADFLERKNDFFIPKWGPTLWEEAKQFPEIPADAQLLLNTLQNEFTRKWGAIEWKEYLETHRTNGEYATDKQLTILAELFNLKFEVTSIINGVTNTTQIIRDVGDETVHFYCENWVHYYIHANGYSDTIGDGNCGYNGFAQWMKLLLLGRTPRREIVLPTAGDIDEDSIVLIQHALLPDLGSPRNPGPAKIDDVVKPFVLNEELSIHTLRKELALPLSFASSSELAKFIQKKAQATIHVILAKKLPQNRIKLLKKISALAKELGHDNKHDKLIFLQQVLLCIVNTVYIPNTQNVGKDWNQVKFCSNMRDLKQLIEGERSSEFSDLKAAIIATDFPNKKPSGYVESLFAPKTSHSSNIMPYHLPSSQPPYHEDLLSSILCVSGIFILLVGLSAQVILIGLALFSGPLHLGIMLMHYGFQAIATSLGGILGLSAPTAAVLVASGTSTMMTGFGLTLFMDSAPPEMLAFNPAYSNRRMAVL